MIKRLMIFWVCFTFIILTVNCSTESDADKKNPGDYREKVELEVSLGSEEGLDDLTENDILFTVKNKGKKIINELIAEFVFLYPDGSEAMVRKWCIITVDENMAKMVSENNKGKFRPLAGGDVFSVGEDIAVFFVGKPEMRKQARKEWNKLSVKGRVIKVETEL